MKKMRRHFIIYMYIYLESDEYDEEFCHNDKNT